MRFEKDPDDEPADLATWRRSTDAYGVM